MVGVIDKIHKRLNEAIRQHPIAVKHRSRFKEEAERTRYIEEFVYAYNRTRLKCLQYQTPLEHLENHTKPYT
jgi:hypothetical protein